MGNQGGGTWWVGNTYHLRLLHGVHQVVDQQRRGDELVLFAFDFVYKKRLHHVQVPRQPRLQRRLGAAFLAEFVRVRVGNVFVLV
jgi:hypothetical protein